MKLSNALGILLELRFAIWTALMPTLRDILKKPSLIFHPTLVSHHFMMHLWVLFGDGLDSGNKETKNTLIPENAYGVVLDIGAGYGHTVNYLDRQKVAKYIALEPNRLMHPEIRKRATAAGFTESDGSFQLLPIGAEHADLICAALSTPAATGTQSVDTLISVLTLCSVPNPEHTILGLLEKVLKPGGTLLFLEHVRHEREDVAWWQGFWGPVWSKVFGGCRLNRPTHLWIDKWPKWKTKDVRWANEEDEYAEHMFCHRIGKYVRAKTM